MKIHSPHGVPPSKRILRFRFWGLWVPTSFRGPKRRHSRCRTVSPFRGTGGRGLGDDGMFLGMFKEFWQDFDGFLWDVDGILMDLNWFWWIWMEFYGSYGEPFQGSWRASSLWLKKFSGRWLIEQSWGFSKARNVTLTVISHPIITSFGGVHCFYPSTVISWS